MTGRRRGRGEGSVYYERDRDRWIGAIVTPDGRRRVTARSKSEAVRRLDAVRVAVRTGHGAPNRNTTVADVVELWRDRELSGRRLAPGTRQRYDWHCRIITTELGSKRVARLTITEVERMLDKMATHGSRTKGGGRPFTRATLVKLRATLVQILEFARRREMVTKNVADLAGMKPASSSTEPRRSLTPDEARRLFDWLGDQGGEEHLASMFRFGLTVGLRPGELYGVLWDDVDLDRQRLVVAHAVQRDGNRWRLVPVLKTDTSYRTLGLPAVAVDELRRNLARQARQRLATSAWGDERLVFPSRAGTLLDSRNVRRELASACVEADVPVIRPNELRHTAASLMVDAGQALEQVADYLGHGSTRMLDSTYRHRVRPSADAAVETMDRVFGRR
jgi:integrase